MLYSKKKIEMKINYSFLEASFIDRPNRFLTRVKYNNKIVNSHSFAHRDEKFQKWLKEWRWEPNTYDGFPPVYKIENFSLSEIKKIFSKNNLILYSSYYPVKDVISFLEPNTIQFKLKKNKGNKTSNKNIKNITLSDFQDLTVSNNQTENIDLYNSIKKLYFPLDKLVKEIDNKSFERKKINLTLKNIIDYKKRLLKIKKINIFNNKHNKIFLNEVIKIYKILISKKSKLQKYKNIKNYLKTTKKIFKGVSGVGMNYYVGYKIK